MKNLIEEAEKYAEIIDYYNRTELKECFIAGAQWAAKESEASKNSKIIEYIERKYGIVVNREDLDNFINREI